MTLSELNEAGYKQTAKELKRFNSMVAGEYKKALDTIRQDIQKIYDKIVGDRSPAELAAILKEQPAWLWTEANKFDRLTALQKKVQTEYIKASIRAGNMTVESSKLAITNNFYRQQFAVGFASPVQTSFTVLNPAVVEVSVLGRGKTITGIVKSTRERIEAKYGDLTRYQPKHGTLINTILNNRQKDLQKIQSAITQGLIQGKSYAQTAKDVKKALDGSASQALRVVRTESARNMNAGAYASHMDAVSQGVELQRQILSVLDDRTRAQSQEVDTRKTNENNQFTYPGGVKVDFPGNTGRPEWDINDRETVIEVIDGQSPDKRTGRNPVTGKNETMSFKDYESWAKNNGMIKNVSGRWVVKPVKK